MFKMKNYDKLQLYFVTFEKDISFVEKCEYIAFGCTLVYIEKVLSI